MATLLIVLKSGGQYDATWVARFAAGARRFAPAFDRVLCLPDLALDVPGVGTVALRHGWWSKMEAFRPDLCVGPVLLCDLDTVFAGDASALAERGLAAMEDYFHKGRVSSALMRWQGSGLACLYETFATEPERWMRPGSCGPVPNSVHGDQVVIDHLMHHGGFQPDFFQNRHPGLFDFYDPARTVYGPVIVFIGNAKPNTAVRSVQALWTSNLQGPRKTGIRARIFRLCVHQRKLVQCPEVDLLLATQPRRSSQFLLYFKADARTLSVLE